MSEQVSSTRPKALALKGSFALESPGERFGEIVTAAARAGLPPWAKQDKPEGLAAFSRTLEELTLTVTVGYDGRASLKITGPAAGANIDPADFKAEHLKTATEGLPDWAANRLDQTLKALPKPKTAATVVDKVVDKVERSGGGWMSRIGLGKRDPEPAGTSSVEAAKKAEAERKDLVRSTFTKAREALAGIEAGLSSSPEIDAYIATSSQFRRTLGQTIRALDLDTGFLQQVRTQYMKKIELAVGNIAETYKSGDLAARPEVTTEIEAQVRAFNDALVRSLESVVSSDVAGNLASIANSAGGNIANAMNVGVGAKVSGRVAPTGTQSILELRAQGTNRPATVDDLTDVFNQNESARFLATFSNRIQQYMGWEMEEPYQLFPTEKHGETELLFYSGIDGDQQLLGFVWRDSGGAIRDVTDDDLKRLDKESGRPLVTKASVEASLEEAASRVEQGLREYFRPHSQNIDAVTPGNLIMYFEREIPPAPERVTELVAAMKKAGWTLPT